MHDDQPGSPEGGSRNVWGWIVLVVIVILIIIGIVALGNDDTEIEDTGALESDELDEIESDLEDTIFEGDAELDEIEAELETETQ